MYEPASKPGTIPLETAVGLVTTPMFQRRLEPDYLLDWKKWRPEMIANAGRLDLPRPFWGPTGT